MTLAFTNTNGALRSEKQVLSAFEGPRVSSLEMS